MLRPVNVPKLPVQRVIILVHEDRSQVNFTCDFVDIIASDVELLKVLEVFLQSTEQVIGGRYWEIEVLKLLPEYSSNFHWSRGLIARSFHQHPAVLRRRSLVSLAIGIQL